LASCDVGALQRVPLRMEPPGRWPFSCRCRCLRGGGFRDACRSVCETIWRTAQPFVGLGVWDDWVRGVRGGHPRMDDPCCNSLHCAVGHCGSGHAVADVAARRSFITRQIARGDQFVAGHHGDGGAGAVHANFRGCHFASLRHALAGRAVLSGGIAPGSEPVAGGLRDKAECSDEACFVSSNLENTVGKPRRAHKPTLVLQNVIQYAYRRGNTMASPLTLRLDEKTRKRIARIARRKRLSTSEVV